MGVDGTVWDKDWLLLFADDPVLPQRDGRVDGEWFHCTKGIPIGLGPRSGTGDSPVIGSSS